MVRSDICDLEFTSVFEFSADASVVEIWMF